MRSRLIQLARTFFSSLDSSGLILGTLALAASLTPSMIPRSAILQGALSGFCFAIGYAVGIGLQQLLLYLEIFPNCTRRRPALRAIVILVCAIVLSFSFWKFSYWQRSLLAVLGLAAEQSSGFLFVILYTILVAIPIFLVARAFTSVIRIIARYLARIVPKRIAFISSLVIAIVIFWSLGAGTLVGMTLRTLDATYSEIDARLEPEVLRPTDPLKSGSPHSLIGWEDLGRTGRAVVAALPSRDDISRFSGKPALEPLRVYVGKRNANTAAERAILALEELKRIGAFDRSILVIATPTGTGWLDPASQATVEYLAHGDIATVAVQYSYLPSWLTLLTDPDYGVESAQRVFHVIYSYWRELPKATRPRLYLHGLSLGSLNSDLSINLFDILADPFHGVLWSGPPFPSHTWKRVTAQRNPDSPAWLPVFRDSSAIRFKNQTDSGRMPGLDWGPVRIVYLQYANDPITFFKTEYLFREPEWMEEPRGPGLSPSFRWYPVVTFMQLIFDVMTATTTPPGVGHVYAAEHYIDSWSEVLNSTEWSEEEIERLKKHLKRD